MFYLRGYLVVLLLCAISALISCKRCTVNEEQNPLESEACGYYRGSFDADVFDGHASSEAVSKYSVEQHSLENVCPPSNSFCFPSTLTRISVNEIDVESEASDASGVLFEGSSSGLKQPRSNLTWTPHHGVFRFLDGGMISCSLYQQDGFHKFPPSDDETKNNQQIDVSSCVSPLYDRIDQGSKSGQYPETVKSGLLDGLSAPPVEVRPSLLDWGRKNMYYPSLAFLTVKNVDSDNVLSVYDPYSSNSQFYPCNFSEMFLAPGEVASICFVFFPTQLGVSSAQIVLQTSFGGFLIQAKGSAVESPYLVKPLSGFGVSSIGRWKANLSLFNPFDDTLYVEEVTAWISTSSGITSRSSRAICSIRGVEDSGNYSVLSSEDWLNIERGEVGPEISMRPLKNWKVGPQTTGTIVELDVSYSLKGKIVGIFSLQLSRPSTNEIDTVMVPLEAEPDPSSAPDTGPFSVSLEAALPCNTSGSLVVALSVKNDSPCLLSVSKVKEVGEHTDTFQIKYLEGLILFPNAVTRVAILSYDHHLETPEAKMNCKLLILVNDTRNTHIEIPCKDVINVCSGHKLDSSVGYTKGFNSADNIDGRKRSFSSSMPPTSEIKAMDTRDADELVLRNWKSQASASFMSVLDAKELLIPVTQIGNYSSQWITVKNPSLTPVVVQLILNSGEVIDKCRKPEMLLQPSSSSILVGNKSIAPTKYGFSVAKGALTEAFVHPYGTASLGPILFQPSNRCEWRSSALVRNNLSGVEWLSLRGFGSSLSLVLHEGSAPVQSLEFKLKNFLTQLNASSPDILLSAGGKSPSCSQPLAKEVSAKNTGDLPLDIVRIGVSGAECGLDGFVVHNCKGFSLQPGESARLQISYLTDFSAVTVQRDLELALATGILVIPMKASLPIHMLNFCKRSMFWMRVKKTMLVLLLASFLLYLLVSLLFPRVTAFTSDDLKSGKNSFSTVIRALNPLHMHFNLKNSGAMSPGMNGFVRSVDGEKALLLESAGTCSDGVNPSDGYLKQKNSSQPETKLVATALSKSPIVENSNMQDMSDSRNLKVRVGKEKGRRRRKKRSSGAGVMLFEVSSSQSGNSTPSSPLSPVASITPKRPWSVSSGMEQSVEARNPFARAPEQQLSKSKCSEPFSKFKVVNNEMGSVRNTQKWGYPSQEKPGVTRIVAGRAFLLPSATFPSAGRVVPTWASQSPFLASKSTIAPHARAPGTKIHKEKTSELGEKVGVEEKFTYDIWGDHLFGLPMTCQSKEVPSNYSQSFFVEDPQALLTKSLLKHVVTPCGVSLKLLQLLGQAKINDVDGRGLEPCKREKSPEIKARY